MNEIVEYISCIIDDIIMGSMASSSSKMWVNVWINDNKNLHLPINRLMSIKTAVVRELFYEF